jgi:preprotein translocase subunit YajC
MDLLFIAPEVEGAEGKVEEVTTTTNNADASENAENGAPTDSTDTTQNTEYIEEVALNSGGEQTSTDQTTDAGNPWSFWIMIGAMILIMYFFMWRPERKRRKQMEQFRQGLKKGDKVITAGGIYGTVKEVNDTSLLLELEGHTTLRVDKGMVVADPSNGTAR